MTSELSWKNLIELWTNAEEILFIISNKAGEIPREGIEKYAPPISKDVQANVSNGTIYLEDEKSLVDFIKNVQSSRDKTKDRRSGINFMNIGTRKNTIEFRLSNGTLDADTWIQNINLFGGIVKAAEELARIEQKQERNENEQLMLDSFYRIKQVGTSQEDKLELLLSIAIPKEKREIYKERYEINRKLLGNDYQTSENIKRHIALQPITIKSICKKVFYGEVPITGSEYYHGSTMIEEFMKPNSCIKEQEN